MRSFPDFAGTWMVSTLDIALISGTVIADVRDAWTPVWSPTGRELYYQSGGTIVAVPVRVEGAFASAAPRVLFENGAVPSDATGPQFDVSPDGQRLLVLESVAGVRKIDRIEIGQEFEIERLDPGEYRLVRVAPAPNEGMVDWLLSCPGKDFFVLIESESTDAL